MRNKLTSRKFWALVAVLATSFLTLFNFDNETMIKVTALITSAGATIAYLFIQGSLDKNDWDESDKTH